MDSHKGFTDVQHLLTEFTFRCKSFILASPHPLNPFLKLLQADDEFLLLVDEEVVEFVELLVEDPDEPLLEADPGAGGAGIDGIGRDVLDELLEGLVAQELVPPLRQRLLQMVAEILAEFHLPLSLKALSLSSFLAFVIVIFLS